MVLICSLIALFLNFPIFVLRTYSQFSKFNFLFPCPDSGFWFSSSLSFNLLVTSHQLRFLLYTVEFNSSYTSFWFYPVLKFLQILHYRSQTTIICFSLVLHVSNTCLIILLLLTSDDVPYLGHPSTLTLCLLFHYSIHFYF